MLPHLPQEHSVSVAVTMVVAVAVTVMISVLMKLAGFFKIVAFTGSAEESDGGKQQGKAFHWLGDIAAAARIATPKRGGSLAGEPPAEFRTKFQEKPPFRCLTPVANPIPGWPRRILQLTYTPDIIRPPFYLPS